MYRPRATAIVLGALVLGTGCSSDQAASDQPADTPPASSAPTPVEIGAPDPALASQGATLFQTRGCIGCHTIGGGRLTGPDLAGVTERRSPEWIIAMIVNPDSMLKVDPDARKLFAEYMTPMLGVGITREEARALYEHLRQQN